MIMETVEDDVRDYIDGFAARHPELKSGKGTIRLRPDEAARFPDSEFRDLVRGARRLTPADLTVVPGVFLKEGGAARSRPSLRQCEGIIR